MKIDSIGKLRLILINKINILIIYGHIITLITYLLLLKLNFRLLQTFNMVAKWRFMVVLLKKYL